MTIAPIVGTDPADVAVVPESFDVSSLWAASFPSADLVSAAAALLTPRPAAGRLMVGRDRSARAYRTTEGQRARIVIGPGSVQVARVDPARAERHAERVRRVARASADLLAADLLLEHKIVQADAALTAVSTIAAAGLADWSDVDRAGDEADYLAGRLADRDSPAPAPPARISAWSAKSRANMVRTLAQIDFAPLFGPGMGLPCMLTLTYPGDWLTVAPSPAACKAHVDTFKRRYLRAYGTPLVGVWKREFQHRGAPHYHILMVPPRTLVNGLNFKAWVARTWADVVAHPDADERAKHVAAGTGIDYAEGTKARDPKRLAVYFSKHGAYGAKEYQNQAPVEWAETGSVGRFWGVWGLSKGTATVEVTEVEARAAARTLRRWQRANGYRVQKTVWRTDTRTGLMRKRKSGVWSGARMRGVSGFVVVNDGAAMVSTLARHLDAVREDAQRTELDAWANSPVRLRALDVDQTPAAAEPVEVDRCDLLCVWPPLWRTGGADNPLPVQPSGWAGAVPLF